MCRAKKGAALKEVLLSIKKHQQVPLPSHNAEPRSLGVWKKGASVSCTKLTYRSVVGVERRSNRASVCYAQECHHKVYLLAVNATLLITDNLAAYTYLRQIYIASNHRHAHAARRSIMLSACSGQKSMCSAGSPCSFQKLTLHPLP